MCIRDSNYTDALLLGIKETDQNSIQYNEDIEEVSLLCKTLGLQIVSNCQHNLRKIYPATYISKQKASEIINKATELNCDNIVINAEISPRPIVLKERVNNSIDKPFWI